MILNLDSYRRPQTKTDVLLNVYKRQAEKVIAIGAESLNNADILKLLIPIIKIISSYGGLKTDFKKNNRNRDYLFLIFDLIGKLTPRELMQAFPVSKVYDGEKYESKDYFYTMKYIKEMDIGKPIGTGEEVFKFLWEYQNIDLKMLMVSMMSVMNTDREIQGKTTLMKQILVNDNEPLKPKLKVLKGEM